MKIGPSKLLLYLACAGLHGPEAAWYIDVLFYLQGPSISPPQWALSFPFLKRNVHIMHQTPAHLPSLHPLSHSYTLSFPFFVSLPSHAGHPSLPPPPITIIWMHTSVVRTTVHPSRWGSGLGLTRIAKKAIFFFAYAENIGFAVRVGAESYVWEDFFALGAGVVCTRTLVAHY